MQVVGFFHVAAARLCAGDRPITALVGGASCSIGSALQHRVRLTTTKIISQYRLLTSTKEESTTALTNNVHDPQRNGATPSSTHPQHGYTPCAGAQAPPLLEPRSRKPFPQIKIYHYTPLHNSIHNRLTTVVFVRIVSAVAKSVTLQPGHRETRVYAGTLELIHTTSYTHIRLVSLAD